ncbi:MAG: hypothetical protein GDA54_01515 [Alphaproteobacteria bacterium GM7ARS4]|nr:hypothetical protein [Alphaproteobacteria bacterium GM7ARS4]
MTSALKQQNGVFYTTGDNPFSHGRFIRWALEAGARETTILEPFAGANHIIAMLQEVDVCRRYASFDINPQGRSVSMRDTLKDFPRHYHVCITNPPWLYKSRAKRLNLTYPDTPWDDLYKHCLQLCLDHCPYVAALVPASFLNSHHFLRRLDSVIMVQKRLFRDTENPVCLALFCREAVTETDIFVDDKPIGTLSALRAFLPTQSRKDITFNVRHGALGLMAIDNSVEPSIRFCWGDDVDPYAVRHSSRSITRIDMGMTHVTQRLIDRLNDQLAHFREKTYDVFMTTFKGIRRDGQYRRRLDYTLARKMMTEWGEQGVQALSPPFHKKHVIKSDKKDDCS